MSEHLEILQLSIERQSKSLIVKQAPILHSLFLKVFDTRRIQFCPRTEDSYEDDEIEVVEHKVNEVAIKMIYKLNDASFRPLFVKMQEWASASGTQKQKQGKIFRQTTWYTFLHTFFDTLKSIVTSYASYIIDDTVTILQSLNPSDPDSLFLFNRVLTTLSSSFEHDQDGTSTPLLPSTPLSPHITNTLRSSRFLAIPLPHHFHPSHCHLPPPSNLPPPPQHHHRSRRHRQLPCPPQISQYRSPGAHALGQCRCQIGGRCLPTSLDEEAGRGVVGAVAGDVAVYE